MAIITSRLGLSNGVRPTFDAMQVHASADTEQLPVHYRKWRRAALAHSRVLREAIERAVADMRKGGQARAVREAVGRFLASRDNQMLSLRRVSSQRRQGCNSLWEQEFVRTWEARDSNLFRELDPMQPSTERRTLLVVRKSDGGLRRTWRFGPTMRARHILVKDALEPLLAGRLWRQMYFDGGRVVGLNAVKDALRDPVYSHFAHVDIASFFDSVDMQGATHLLPLHRRVMENTLCIRSQDRSLTRDGCIGAPYANEDVAARRPLALLQGAASSPFIAYYLLESALTGIEDVFPYADNALILGSSREDVEAEVSRYRSNLVGHPVGPLQLRTIEVGEVTRAEGFDFLGVNFATTDAGYGALRRVTTTVSSPTLDAFREKLDVWLSKDAADDPFIPKRTCEALRGFLLAMPTDDRRDVLKLALRRARRHRVATGPLSTSVRDLVGAVE